MLSNIYIPVHIPGVVTMIKISISIYLDLVVQP